MQEEWFKTWFNSPYYHKLYKSRDKQEAQVFIRNLIDHLGTKLDHNILDLACGKGRHSVFLNTLGYETTGIDIAPESIAFAQQFSNAKLNFKVGDMRSSIDGNYNLILNLFTSFGYFESIEEHIDVLTNISKSLKPNGICIIDFFNAEKVIDGLVPKEEKAIDGTHFHITKKISIESNYQRINKTISFKDDEEDVLSFTEKVFLFTIDDFKILLEKASLEIVATFGDYNLKEYKSNSPRLILQCQLC